MTRNKNMEKMPMTWGAYEQVRALDTELQRRENKRDKITHIISLIAISLLVIIGISTRINTLQVQINEIKEASYENK